MHSSILPQEFISLSVTSCLLTVAGATAVATAVLTLARCQAYFNKHSELGEASRAMLTQWEERDAGVHELWQLMKDWCTDGFDQTYSRLGVSVASSSHICS